MRQSVVGVLLATSLHAFAKLEVVERAESKQWSRRFVRATCWGGGVRDGKMNKHSFAAGVYRTLLHFVCALFARTPSRRIFVAPNSNDIPLCMRIKTPKRRGMFIVAHTKSRG